MNVTEEWVVVNGEKKVVEVNVTSNETQDSCGEWNITLSNENG